MIVIRVSLILLFCISSLLLSGQSYDLAKEYLKQGDLSKAENEFESIARKKASSELIYTDFSWVVLRTPLPPSIGVDSMLNWQLGASPHSSAALIRLQHVFFDKRKNCLLPSWAILKTVSNGRPLRVCTCA